MLWHTFGVILLVFPKVNAEHRLLNCGLRVKKRAHINIANFFRQVISETILKLRQLFYNL